MSHRRQVEPGLRVTRGSRDVGIRGPWPLAEPFRIGRVEIANRVVQAPLAGIANWAYRRQSNRSRNRGAPGSHTLSTSSSMVPMVNRNRT